MVCLWSGVIVFIMFSSMSLARGSSAALLLEEEEEGRTKKEKENADQLPNIVILFADNLGYDDISLFRESSSSSSTKTTTTPNVDRLGKEGMKFTNWNSAAALCSASRSALMTSKYPIRTGTYPRVFRPDATYGLLPEEVTLAELLKEKKKDGEEGGGYATSIVGKWHLGHQDPYLPTNQGFDSWVGIPYHMSGGSVDNHECNDDVNHTMWLPLYQNASITQQPVILENLASTYASASVSFITHNVQVTKRPFFLYMAFSHVHQMCAPRDFPEQSSCQWAAVENATFNDAVEEMDWITGQILNALDDTGATNNTIVIFTSDNGPWVAEQACSGSKGPFKGEWFRNHVDQSCTACPNGYIPDPTENWPSRCVLPGTSFSLDGVHCGEDTGLGSVWEANMRMPAVVRYPPKVPPNSESSELVSTLDVLPTLMSMIGKPLPEDLVVDGMDVSDIFYGIKKSCTKKQQQQQQQNDDDSHVHETDLCGDSSSSSSSDNNNNNQEDGDRVLFFWRDGFQDGPLPAPYGRFDVAAVKYGKRIKAWFWTKSAHYNDDVEEFHDPPLLFDTISDPAESTPLDPTEYEDVIQRIHESVRRHKASIDWSIPLTLAGAPENIPCVDQQTGCRTHSTTGTETKLITNNPDSSQVV